MSERLLGKVALVFGAGSSGPGLGNGKAVAMLFAREGAQVIAIDVNPDAANETAAIIREEGGAVVPVAADVTNSADVRAAVQVALAQFGRIDILHNNVGATDMAELTEISDERWRRGLDINLTRAFLTCREVVPIMARQRAGAIINVSSLASIQINRYPYFSYFSGKATLNHFTRAIAVRYAADGVRANAILPGVIDTPLVESRILGQFSSREEMIRARNDASPMGRMGTPLDVAYAALFLASDEAAYITGVTLPIDGGKSCVGR